MMPVSAENHTPKTKAPLSGEVEEASKCVLRKRGGDLTHVEVAGYLVDLIGELAALARTRKLDNVAYFLDMARIEAGFAERKDG